MSDPQTDMCTILKPYKGFETIYQGRSPSIPIPLTGVEGLDADTSDLSSPGPEYDPLMLRYVPVPLGSVILIWFPRIVWEDPQSHALQEIEYNYHLRWRLRSIQDRIASNEVKTYQMVSSRGAITAPGGSAQQLAVPACIGQDITPTLPTTANLSLGFNIQGQLLADSQGFYGSVALPNNEQVTRGPVYYPPVQVPCIGNELVIYADRAVDGERDTWQFGPSGMDQGFSLFYGVGAGGPSHPWYPSHGIYITSMGSTASVLTVNTTTPPVS